MRLEPLCDMELVYREEKIYGGGFTMVRPYGGEEGSAYGEGDGTVNGARLKGKMRWVNHPHRRNDGVMLPNVHGVIVTDDGAKIIFSLEGRTVFKGENGFQLLNVVFEAEDERYLWLNNTLCVLEGIINQTMKAKVYECIHEMQPNTNA